MLPDLLIASRSDEASKSMLDYILEKEKFTQSNSDKIMANGNFLLAVFDERHLYLDNIEQFLNDNRMEAKGVIFLSRHSSKADIKSITVHPTGNFAGALLGGKPGTLTVSYPVAMSASLRYLKENFKGDNFEITFEATHHGPLLNKMNYYIEIGTTEKQWKDTEALEVVRGAIFNREDRDYDTFVGIGGGHYMPKITEYFLKNNINMGHMIPKYALDSITEDMIIQAVEKTPGCKGFLMDKKGTKAPARDLIKKISDERKLEIISI